MSKKPPAVCADCGHRKHAPGCCIALVNTAGKWAICTCGRIKPPEAKP